MGKKKSSEMLEKIKEYARQENLSQSKQTYESNDPRLIEAALELSEKSKSILGGLYYDFRKPSDSFVRNLKNKVIGKITNIVRNTLERPLLTQQKFNEQSHYLVKVLIEENKKMKKEIADIKKNIGNRKT